MNKRREALIRIIIALISGFILSLWKILIQIIAVIHWIYVIVKGKRNKELAEFAHVWNVQVYHYLKYVTFATNKRVFPFANLKKEKADLR